MNNDINNNENEHYSIYSHDELEDELYEEQVQNEFNENFSEHRSSGLGMYFVYAFIFVAVLITFGVSSTYAYYTMSTGTSSSTTAITATADCLDISIDGTSSQNLSLQFNYPVIDDYALSHITPYIIKIKNSCTKNIAPIKYTLTLSSVKLSAEINNYISDDQVKVKITKQINSSDVTEIVPMKMLNTMTELLSTDKSYSLVSTDITTKLSGYTLNKPYIIDSSGSLNNSETATYSVYLWIDYNEGGKGSNSTANKKFSAVASLAVV